MKKLSENVIKELVNLAKNGFSLKLIVTKTKVPKTTVYNYVKPFLKSKKLNVDMTRLSDGETGYLLGLFAGDGNFDFRKDIYAYRVVFNFNKKTEGKIVEKLVNILSKCGTKPYIIDYQKKNVRRIVSVSKDLFQYLSKFFVYKLTQKNEKIIKKKYGIKNFKKWDKRLKYGFIAGLIDSDGYVGLNVKSPFIILSTGSELLLKQSSKILNEVKIKFSSYSDRNIYVIRIGANAYRLFKNIIPSVKLINKS